MRAIAAIFRADFNQHIQYRASALAGLTTQFFWGFMYILLYMAFLRSNPSAFPMTQRELMSYVWLNQGLLIMVVIWFVDLRILDDIVKGNVAYELCRPMDLYHYWFIKSVSRRLARAWLRMVPLFAVAALLPQPYRLMPPYSLLHGLAFLVSMLLGFFILNALTMFLYAGTFYTLNPTGIRTLMAAFMDLLSGSLIPLPFFPDAIRRLLELLPFGSVQNAPFLIYSGHIPTERILPTILLQLFWCLVLYAWGRLLFARMIRRVSFQGG